MIRYSLSLRVSNDKGKTYKLTFNTLKIHLKNIKKDVDKTRNT